MSKRFVDYYLEAVTKKSGGGGGYPEPTGTINITSNGTHNVKDKATANVNVPNDYIPASGYTELTATNITRSSIDGAYVGKTSWQFRVAVDDPVAVNDKVIVKGTLQESSADAVLYAVWGTVTYANASSTYKTVRITVEGSSVRPYTASQKSISSNGVTDVMGRSKVNVSVSANVGQKTIYSDGTYYASSDGFDGYDVVEVNTGGGGGGSAEIIIPDNSLGVYIEGEGDQMEAQAVVDWFDMFDPSSPIGCTFQGATPSTDDKVLIIGDVVSSIDFVTKVGRYAIWGVCGSPYDGTAINFSEASGYSVVDEEMPMNATTITAENDTTSPLIEAYTNESGSQKLDINIPSGGGGGDYEVFEGSFEAEEGTKSVTFDSTPSGDLLGYMVSVRATALLTVNNKLATCCAFMSEDDTSSYPIRIAGTARGGSSSVITAQHGALQNFPSSSTARNYIFSAITYNGVDGFDYYASPTTGSSNAWTLMSGAVYDYVAIFKKTV